MYIVVNVPIIASWRVHRLWKIQSTLKAKDTEAKDEGKR